MALMMIGCAPSGPADLSFSFPDESPVAYTVHYQQAVQTDMGDAPIDATRDVSVQITFGGVDATVSSMDAGVVTSDGRTELDTEGSAGSVFELHLSDAKSRPHFHGDIPTADLGAMEGGEISAGMAVEQAFLVFPEELVEIGGSWTEERRRLQIEGRIRTVADLATTYTFVGYEKVDGVWTARVDGETTGSMVPWREPGEGGEGWDYSGTLSGTATWYFDFNSGNVLRATVQESTEGTAVREETTALVTQTTTVEVQRTGH